MSASCTISPGSTCSIRGLSLLRTARFPDWIADEHKRRRPDGPSPGVDRRSLPLLHLCGDDPQGQEDVAAIAAAQAGRQFFTLRAERASARRDADLEQLARLWQRKRCCCRRAC